ncbi:MAG: hypothetical protein K2P86_04990 [Xanthobacteraceae bacterium]|nr:hypothetical protein [Xanthobacteraceae bacterium]
MEETALSLKLPAIVYATEPFIPQAWPPVIRIPERKVLHSQFDKHIAKFTKEDLDYFEALVFLRADQIARPYSALMRAPAMNHKASCEALVKHAVGLVGKEVEAARKSDPRLAGKILAYMIAALCEAPGCIPRGIEVDGPGFGDGADINIGHERGRPLSNYYTAAHAHLYVFNSFNFFGDVLGPHSSIQFANDHLTEMGIEFAKRLWPERIEEMRRREGAGAKG